MKNSGQTQRQTPRTKHRRSAKGSTCTNCRQQKLKCNAIDVQPEPCSRCQQTGQRCVIDPAFRRRGNREYTRSLEQEIQTLRDFQIVGPPTSDSSRADQSTEHMSLLGTSPPGVSPRFEHVCDQTLESVSLPSTAILSLIQQYFTHYHPHFPILPDMELFILEYDSNRLLLWTIIAIASKGLVEYPALFPSLVDPVRKMAADIYAPQSRSLRTMQALLLLSTWPFPFQQTHNDPSHMYASLATNIGYSLGLHRPLHKADFEEQTAGITTSNAVERKTWYGCFIVNQGLAMRLGIPATLTPGNAILSATASSEGSDISKTLLLELDLSLMSYQWMKLLGDDDSTSSGQCVCPENLIQTFENQCNQLRQRHAGSWSSLSELTFHDLQLQVYSFVIDKEHSHRTATSNELRPPSVTIAKAVSTVVQLVSSASKAKESKEYWTIFAKHHVMFGTCIALYMAATTAEITTRLTLLDVCKEGISLQAGFSMFPRDSFSRIGRHIATAVRRVESQGWKGLQIIDAGNHKALITARMAANIPYRIVWSAKHGKTPDQVPGSQQPVLPTHEVPALPGAARGAETFYSQSVPQPYDLLFNDLDDIALFDSLNDTDFTNILLDWETLKGPIPDWT